MVKSKRNTNKKDPHYKREKAKYQNPIPSREYILDLLAKKAEPLPFDAIRTLLHIEPDSPEHEALKRRLTAMERDGQVIRNRKLGYGLIDKMDLFKAKVLSRKEGDGLLKDEHNVDWYLSSYEMRKVMHGDTVLARADERARRGKKEAKIVEVVDHEITQIVGRLYEKESLTYVVPENKRISATINVAAKDRGKARHGQVVVVAIIERPSFKSPPVGKVIEVLGDHLAPGMEIEIAVRDHQIPHLWPRAVESESTKINFNIGKREYLHRKDLRDLPLVTIDGEDARDFDDAVYCEPKKSGGWRLWVAIADVSYYVQPGTALDDCARERGTSVYFPNNVIPMLPEVLSNGVCSLKPDEERRCMVCEMTISQRGKLSGYQFYTAIMKSWARLTYTEVANMLDEQDNSSNPYKHLLPHLNELHKLYKVLKGVRANRGALEFDSLEPVFQFSDDRKIESILLRERNDAHKLIEECMILANIAAARFLNKHDIHALVRNHLGPSDKKLLALQQFLSEKGIAMSAKSPTPLEFAAILRRAEGRVDQEQIQTMLLRSMNQAVYEPEIKGHFGLALSEYAHFTSPIRRYPDLVVHRVIKQQLAKILSKRAGYEGRVHYAPEELIALGEHTSFTERRAEEATRDVNDWLKCEFMQDKVGALYSGTISGVTHFGLFVRLDDYFIEGLIHVTQLQNDYYHFDAGKMILVGEKNRRRFAIGDRVDIIVARVDLDSRRIDFELRGMENNKAGSKKRKSLKSKVDNIAKLKSGSKKSASAGSKAGAKSQSGKAKKVKNKTRKKTRTEKSVKSKSDKSRKKKKR